MKTQIHANKDFLINNYYSSQARKFTFLNLELRKLSSSDIVILALSAIAITVHFIVTANYPEKRLAGLFLIASAAWIITTTTPFGLRFRNLYFFGAWLVICFSFLFAGTSLCLLPLACFILYQIIRLLFWRKYHKEFIPFKLVPAPIEFSRKAFELTFIRVVSKIEGRGGYLEDKLYMKWLVRLGFCLFVISLFGMVGLRFEQLND